MNTKILNANALKLIAIIAMTLDHLAWALWPEDSLNGIALVMHMLGRLTMPIMCFLIAEGYQHTRDWRKYLARLFGFAVFAHFAFVFAFYYRDPLSFLPFAHGEWQAQTSVLWGLAWGLILVRVFDTSWKLPWKLLMMVVILFITLPADWMCITPLLILVFWLNRGHFVRQMLCGGGVMLVYTVVELMIFRSYYHMINIMFALCVLVLWQYNGQRGQSPRVNQWLKWCFYIYYPLHLFIIGLLAYMGVFPIN